MKKERRHDLETNWLAARLSSWITTLKPYSNLLLIAVTVGIGIWAASLWWSSFSAAAEKTAWQAFATAQYSADPELMSMRKLALADQYVGTRMQDWAQITWADRQVLLAAQAYLRDRPAANSRLQSVIGIYDGLTSSARDERIRDRAHFGLGRVYELQNKLEQARQQYELVTGDLVGLASERAEQLASEEVQQAYAWLATAKLPPRDRTGGQGASGTRPDFQADLPTAEDGERRLQQLLEDFEAEAGGEDTAENAADREADEEASEMENAADAAADAPPEEAGAAVDEAEADSTGDEAATGT